MLTKITITNEDVAKARSLYKLKDTWVSRSCPVALAFNRQTNRACSVGLTGISLLKPDTEYNLPEEIISFIFAFDNNLPLPSLPLTFEIEDFWNVNTP